MKKIHDFRVSEIEIQAEIDRQLANRTPEEVAQDECNTMENLEKLKQRMEEHARTYCKVPNLIKRKNFLSVADYLLELAEFSQGVFEISQDDSHGTMSITCENLGYLFDSKLHDEQVAMFTQCLHFDYLDIQQVDGMVCMSITHNFYDDIRIDSGSVG